jgi:hypothetical protein
MELIKFLLFLFNFQAIQYWSLKGQPYHQSLTLCPRIFSSYVCCSFYQLVSEMKKGEEGIFGQEKQYDQFWLCKEHLTFVVL